jgi:hypothetical protein
MAEERISIPIAYISIYIRIIWQKAIGVIERGHEMTGIRRDTLISYSTAWTRPMVDRFLFMSTFTRLIVITMFISRPGSPTVVLIAIHHRV